MKILSDMNLSSTWVPCLVEAGTEAVQWASVGNPSAPGQESLDWAREGGYIVFTLPQLRDLARAHLRVQLKRSSPSARPYLRNPKRPVAPRVHRR